MEEYQLAESIKKAKYCALMGNFNGFLDIIRSMRVLESQNISADVLREAYDLAILLGEKRIYLEATLVLSYLARNPNTPRDILAELISGQDYKIAELAKQNPQMQPYLTFE